MIPPHWPTPPQRRRRGLGGLSDFEANYAADSSFAGGWNTVQQQMMAENGIAAQALSQAGGNIAGMSTAQIAALKSVSPAGRAALQQLANQGISTASQLSSQLSSNINEAKTQFENAYDQATQNLFADGSDAIDAAQQYVQVGKTVLGAIGPIQNLVGAFQHGSTGQQLDAFIGAVMGIAATAGVVSAGVGALITAGVGLAVEALSSAGLIIPNGNTATPGDWTLGGLQIFGAPVSPGSLAWRRFPSPVNPNDLGWFVNTLAATYKSYEIQGVTGDIAIGDLGIPCFWQQGPAPSAASSGGTVSPTWNGIAPELTVDDDKRLIDIAFPNYYLIEADAAAPAAAYAAALNKLEGASALTLDSLSGCWAREFPTLDTPLGKLLSNPAYFLLGPVSSTADNYASMPPLLQQGSAFNCGFANALKGSWEYGLNGLKPQADAAVLGQYIDMWNRTHVGPQIALAQSPLGPTYASMLVSEVIDDGLFPQLVNSDGLSLLINTGEAISELAAIQQAWSWGKTAIVATGAATAAVAGSVVYSFAQGEAASWALGKAWTWLLKAFK